MNILIVGSGGREHALAWKIAQSPLCTRLVCAPGNPGMASLGEIADVGVRDVAGQVALARSIAADLVVIGPEAGLEAGLADAMAEVGIPCFGPTAKAAQLESSKVFTKGFAVRHGVPTAAYGAFDTAAAAKAFIADLPGSTYVIKADGLASGKGVVIAEGRAEADAAVDEMLGGRFGAASGRIVVEEFMPGEEASLFAITDGTRALLFGGAQDHKRVHDGDVGPNTGGMGAYSPAPVLTPALTEEVMARMIRPTVAGMAAENMPYRGVLYAGIMLTPDGPKLVEYNARFGDPETQVLMLRLDSDLVPYLLACATGDLGDLPPPRFRDEAAICVVMASEGSPLTPKGGSIVRGAGQDFGPDVVVFHADTKAGPDGALLAGGGRVLNVCARGATLRAARDAAYAAIDRIDWPEGFCRRDIGWRELARA